MEVYRFSEIEILAFLLVLLRVSALMATIPIIGTESVPPYAKVLFSLAIALLIFPVTHWKSIESSLMDERLLLYAFREVFVGVFMGFLFRFFFFSLTVCGEIVSVIMGLSGEQLFNPTVGGRSGAMDQFYIFLGTMVFLSMSGHHLFLLGLSESYDVLPLTTLPIRYDVFSQYGTMMTEVVSIGLQMAGPVVATIFVLNISLGLMSRLIPQINILVTSVSVNVLAGMLMLMFSIPLLAYSMSGLIRQMGDHVFELMKQL